MDRSTSEQRLYISSLDSSAERLSQITKQHWAIESMHWDLDRNLRQDSIKRKAERAARNLDTIQRMVLALIAVWKNRRKKKYQISKKGNGADNKGAGGKASLTCCIFWLKNEKNSDLIYS
mgnify:CR=1 FL=1